MRAYICMCSQVRALWLLIKPVSVGKADVAFCSDRIEPHQRSACLVKLQAGITTTARTPLTTSSIYRLETLHRLITLAGTMIARRGAGLPTRSAHTLHRIQLPADHQHLMSC